MIELLVVATIMIILTAIGLVSYQNATRNARNGKRKADLETVRSALVLYRTDNGEYPDQSTFDAAITELYTDGYISASAMTDPKGAPYAYTYSTTGSTFTICADLEPDQTDYCLNNP